MVRKRTLANGWKLPLSDVGNFSAKDVTMKKLLLDSFFKPDSVAVIGASEKEGRIGSTLVHNLIRGGFPGKIFPLTGITLRFTA